MKKRITGFLSHFRPLGWTLLLLLGLHSGIRAVFLLHNFSLFPPGSGWEYGRIFLQGLQQDAATVALLSLPALFFLLLWEYLPRLSMLKFLFVLLFAGFHTAGLFLNLLDAGYFPFSKHRTNLELWHIFLDSSGSFGTVLQNHWYLLLLGACLLVFLRFQMRAFTREKRPYPLPAPRRFIHHLLLLLLLGMFLRGFERKVLGPYTPLLHVAPSNLPIAQNSVLTFSYSLFRKQHRLTDHLFFSKSELDRLFVPVRQMGRPGDSMQRKNVVVFILESFARGYLQPGHRYKAKTPFFDSLAGKSLQFTNAFATNGTSAEAIVSLLSSVPSFLEEPLFYSSYANTELQGIGKALKEKGYSTHFFMGAEEDHFGFGKFSRMVGFDRYYSRKDFGNDRFYDGNWGIFDRPFLQYGAGVLSRTREPFLATFFTISSHYPFTLPPGEEARFQVKGQQANQNSITYVDDAFRSFFEKAARETWFRNTLFVFVADHWYPPGGMKEMNGLNAFTIPFFIYDPSGTYTGQRTEVASQLDLVPTILHMLRYNGTYKGFGHSLLQPRQNPYAINRYLNLIYQCVSKDYLLGFDPLASRIRYLYRYRGDSLVSPDLSAQLQNDSTVRHMEQYTKAFIQQYNGVLNRRSFR